MARRYRMTPKRKAALRKAQAASARKRRRTRNRRLAVAGGVTVLAATAAAAGLVGHRYVRGLKGGPKRPNVVSVTTTAATVSETSALIGPQLSEAQKAGIVASRAEAAVAREKRREANAVKREISRSKKERRHSRKRSKYWQGKQPGRPKKIPKRNRFTRRNYFG